MSISLMVQLIKII